MSDICDEEALTLTVGQVFDGNQVIHTCRWTNACANQVCYKQQSRQQKPSFNDPRINFDEVRFCM